MQIKTYYEIPLCTHHMLVRMGNNWNSSAVLMGVRGGSALENYLTLLLLMERLNLFNGLAKQSAL